MVRVLLTGGSGFIAAHVLDVLLERGHSVVTTVRSTEKGEKILDNHPKVSKDRLDFVIVEDIAKREAFDKAVQSNPPFEAIIHTASPFHFNATDTKKELLDPAVIGTTGILESTKKYAPTVKRVVITSSFASIMYPAKGNRPGYIYSEKDWNPITEEEAVQNPSNGYRASKTFAEKASWDFLEKEKPNFTISTMCPPLVLGPIIHYLQSLDNLNTSNQRIAALMTGKAKEEIPPTGTFIWTDVRDLALAHVKAAELPEAANKRFFVTAGYFSNEEIADIIRDSFPQLKNELPAKGVKGGGYPKEGIYKYDNSRVKEILGIEFRSLKESIVDAVKSLQAVGA
ncbi:MAG: methylglyoxal reductase (NADPH-dependent) gre2 [Alectoria fallacina]|uniref:Methylglyoxal reductase (NADPH-dependent) gre2 n=1 Tax=Alectoria fallacina TaxID=1903189 RepID=A0A8H3EET2_9LECA|nr:MAG: methylglyoxal reductase (NADPH-dependent) gre2 [Alectoria fallacina]